jgi:hypothetical protein
MKERAYNKINRNKTGNVSVFDLIWSLFYTIRRSLNSGFERGLSYIQSPHPQRIQNESFNSSSVFILTLLLLLFGSTCLLDKHSEISTQLLPAISRRFEIALVKQIKRVNSELRYLKIISFVENLLIFNIFLDIIRIDVSYYNNKISSCSKMLSPIFFPQ